MKPKPILDVTVDARPEYIHGIVKDYLYGKLHIISNGTKTADGREVCFTEFATRVQFTDPQILGINGLRVEIGALNKIIPDGLGERIARGEKLSVEEWKEEAQKEMARRSNVIALGYVTAVPQNESKSHVEVVHTNWREPPEVRNFFEGLAEYILGKTGNPSSTIKNTPTPTEPPAMPAQSETSRTVTKTEHQDSLIELFFSYAHEDEALRDELAKHLSLLKRQGVIQEWHDRKITAGTEWKEQIDAHLDGAQIILLLISADFLASDYCADIEMKRAMERHHNSNARVIPIILRACTWQDAPFGKLQALPQDGKPVRSWANPDEAFTDIAEGIKRVVKEIREKP